MCLIKDKEIKDVMVRSNRDNRGWTNKGQGGRKGEQRSCRQYVIWEHVVMAPLASPGMNAPALVCLCDCICHFPVRACASAHGCGEFISPSHHLF